MIENMMIIDKVSTLYKTQLSAHTTLSHRNQSYEAVVHQKSKLEKSHCKFNRSPPSAYGICLTLLKLSNAPVIDS